MTRLSQQTEFRLGSKTRRIERRVALARVFVVWERLWPALWPASGIVGLFLAAALLDLLAPLPWIPHALILAATVTALGLLLYLDLSKLKPTRWDDGARRLERDSALKHRPISEAGDAILGGAGDAVAEELWHAHLRQRLEHVARLRLSPPSPGLARKDPYALRYIVLLLLIGGLAIGGRDPLERLWASLTSAGAGNSATIDAWVEPPAYTGEAPVYLGSAQDRLIVPTGSVLNLRVHGASHLPGLSVDGSSETFQGGNGEYSGTVRLTSDGSVGVRSAGRMLGDWSFKVLPDYPPTIAFTAPPAKTEHDALKLSFKAGDDYGVTSVHAIIKPHDYPGRVLVIDLPLAGPSMKSVDDTVYRDLTEHPYAGLNVDITLIASDAIGQTALSKTVQFRLPARVFTNPLARALVELRQVLAGDSPVSRDRVVRTLDALTIAPERFYAQQPSLYVGLRAAYWALRNAHHEDDIVHVENLLWEMALSLERGGLSVAAEELRRLQQLLTQALAQGAPQEVIDALMERYQQALQRYLQEMAQNAPSSKEPVPPGSRVLSEKDLADLMKIIQQLAQSGDREKAAQMLAILQSLLENLHMTTAAGGQGGEQGGNQSPAEKALNDALQGLGEVMGKQRGLLDKTFRQQQGGSQDGSGLSQEQGQLRNQLDKVMGALKGQRQGVPKELNDAGKDMGDSQQQLSGRDLATSTETQKETLESLRKGADALAKELQQQSGNGRGGAGDEDPLGRSVGSASDLGNGVKLPSQSELQRARSILEELRRRAAERGRPKQELDYIDRLLKQF